jgi:hypothetical protein
MAAVDPDRKPDGVWDIRNMPNRAPATRICHWVNGIHRPPENTRNEFAGACRVAPAAVLSSPPSRNVVFAQEHGRPHWRLILKGGCLFGGPVQRLGTPLVGATVGGRGRKMSVLTYRCPKTLHDVRTAIDTDPLTLARLRDLKVSAACPHCIEGHSIPANEMFFGQVPWPTPLTLTRRMETARAQS